MPPIGIYPGQFDMDPLTNTNNRIWPQQISEITRNVEEETSLYHRLLIPAPLRRRQGLFVSPFSPLHPAQSHPKMIGSAVILGSLAVWLFTGYREAKIAFLLSLATGILRFCIKFYLHRREWAKYVRACCLMKLIVSPDLLIHSFGVTSKSLERRWWRPGRRDSNWQLKRSLNMLQTMSYSMRSPWGLAYSSLDMWPIQPPLVVVWGTRHIEMEMSNSQMKPPMNRFLSPIIFPSLDLRIKDSKLWLAQQVLSQSEVSFGRSCARCSIRLSHQVTLILKSLRF